MRATVAAPSAPSARAASRSAARTAVRPVRCRALPPARRRARPRRTWSTVPLGAGDDRQAGSPPAASTPAGTDPSEDGAGRVSASRLVWRGPANTGAVPAARRRKRRGGRRWTAAHLLLVVATTGVAVFEMDAGSSRLAGRASRPPAPHRPEQLRGDPEPAAGSASSPRASANAAAPASPQAAAAPASKRSAGRRRCAPDGGHRGPGIAAASAASVAARRESSSRSSASRRVSPMQTLPFVPPRTVRRARAVGR